ncbi:CRE-CLEC-145 protein [Caenorhabditis remanei]|uniref:CRE-CLEC-145 protein n=1 Tax=Caenorhabditis remanei TaxID=31234 RepID=E3MMV7_CAERE|nr:CRE-CLEC-145 protein [Caenorhabditis remanei]
MNLKYSILFCFFLALWITQIETRKVTQKPKPPPPPPPPPKKDISWVRSKIDSAKEKYEAGKQKIKSKFSFGSKSDDTKPKETFAQKTTSRKPDLHLKTTKKYGWNSNVQANYAVPNTMFTTKKPLFDRVKEKVKGSEKYVGKAVGWAKKDLGIGVEGPKKPSKILTYGKKAAEYVFKKKSKKTAIAAYSTGRSNSNDYSRDFGNSGSYSGGGNSEVSSDLHQKVEYLKNRLEIMQNTIKGTWNTSEAGTKYKLFEEKKTWNDAQVLHCEELGSNLAYLDSESKNNFAKLLLHSQNITMVWFGLRTEIGTESVSPSQDQFSNFSHLDGCGVVDSNGTWSISSCSMELPYLCQAFRFDVLVEIP